MIGHNGGPHIDPLAGKTSKQIYQMCVWASEEPTNVKIFLLCIARFFDADGRSSSMSYRQVAANCSLGERTAKRVAQDVVGRWLHVEIGKGFRTASGPQNLYHAIIPEDVLDLVRDGVRNGNVITVDATKLHPEGVPHRHPFDGEGCHTDTPMDSKGCHTGTSIAARGATDDSKGCLCGTLTSDNLEEVSEEKDMRIRDAKARVQPSDQIFDDGQVGADDEPDAAALEQTGMGWALPPPDGAAAQDDPAAEPETKPKRASPRRKPAIEQFDRFWDAYPLRKGKAAALKNFMKLTPEQAERAVSGATKFAAECLAKSPEEQRYIKWPQGWLTEQRFEDYFEAARPDFSALAGPNGERWGWWAGKEPEIRALPLERWRAAVAKFKPNGTWPWWVFGPPPGHPECMFPEALSREYGYLETYRGGITHA